VNTTSHVLYAALLCVLSSVPSISSAQTQSMSNWVGHDKVILPTGANSKFAATFNFTPGPGSPVQTNATWYLRDASNHFSSGVGAPAGMFTRVRMTCFANPQHTGSGTVQIGNWGAGYTSVGCPAAQPYGTPFEVQVGSTSSSTAYIYGARPAGLGG
jgi:hypothetical protein